MPPWTRSPAHSGLPLLPTICTCTGGQWRPCNWKRQHASWSAIPVCGRCHLTKRLPCGSGQWTHRHEAGRRRGLVHPDCSRPDRGDDPPARERRDHRSGGVGVVGLRMLAGWVFRFERHTARGRRRDSQDLGPSTDIRHCHGMPALGRGTLPARELPAVLV